MTNTAEYIALYAAAGRTITAATAALYIAQREREIAAYDAAMAGAAYDYTATRPYAQQIRCGCGAWCTWAVEADCDGKPDRLLYCDSCAIAADADGESIAWVQLFTVEQVATRTQLAAAGIGR